MVWSFEQDTNRSKKVKNLPLSKTWVFVFVIVVFAFLSVTTLYTKDCIEADLNRQWFKLGSCEASVENKE